MCLRFLLSGVNGALVRLEMHMDCTGEVAKLLHGKASVIFLFINILAFLTGVTLALLTPNYFLPVHIFRNVNGS